jgi:hypothetical protein
VLDLASKLRMDEKVVYHLFAFLAKTTSIEKGKTPPPNVINHEDFSQSYCPSEEINSRWSLHLLDALLRK